MPPTSAQAAAKITAEQDTRVCEMLATLRSTAGMNHLVQHRLQIQPLWVCNALQERDEAVIDEAAIGGVACKPPQQGQVPVMMVQRVRRCAHVGPLALTL